MIGELVCPDCGGVVGATEHTDAGPPCRCFADASLSGSLSGRSGAGGLGVTDGSSASDSPAPVVEKLCRLCGTDVAGHWRQKDSLGYLCKACARAERDRETGGRVPCRVCAKLTKPENLTEYEGTKMCPKCHRERDEARLTEIKRMGFKGAQVREELHSMYKYLIAGGALLMIILVGVLFNHFRH
jgi:hypothetical protein